MSSGSGMRGALAIMALLCGCGSSVHVPAEQPHGSLHVRITHDDAARGRFDDQVVVNGVALDVGKGQGGERELRLKPGKHKVQLSSALLEYRVTPVTRRDDYGDCMGPDCNFRVPTTRYDQELIGSPAVVCQHELVVDVRPGSSEQAALHSTTDGQCDPGGA